MDEVGLKKILICGDSYMSLASGSRYNSIHWSQHLDKEFEIVNFAQPGASNIMVLDQLIRATDSNRPDAIILGFTGLARLEMYAKEARPNASYDYITSCNSNWFNTNQKNFHKLFLTQYPIELRELQELCLIEYTILLAQSIAPTIYTLGLLIEYLEIKSGKNLYHPRLFDIHQNEFPIRLIDGEHWLPGDPEEASFHVKDPDHHKLFADQINTWLLTI